MIVLCTSKNRFDFGGGGKSWWLAADWRTGVRPSCPNEGFDVVETWGALNGRLICPNCRVMNVYWLFIRQTASTITTWANAQGSHSWLFILISPLRMIIRFARISISYSTHCSIWIQQANRRNYIVDFQREDDFSSLPKIDLIRSRHEDTRESERAH